MSIGIGAVISYSVFHNSKQIADRGIDEAEFSAAMAFEALYTSMSLGGDRDGNRAVVERLAALKGMEEIRIIHGRSIDRQFGIEVDELPQEDSDRAALNGIKVEKIDKNNGSRYARFVKPVFAREICKKCHIVEAGEVLGAISIKIPLQKYDNELTTSAIHLIMIGAAILGVTIILSLIFIMHVIVKPMRRFQRVAQSIGEGDRSIALKDQNGLEINVLADEFNRMASKLQDFSKDLEKKVQDRTKELAEEIEERKRAEETVRHMAYHDPLTGLPNRLLLIDRLNQILARGRWNGKETAVIYLDFNSFKVVNDTLGHPAGDEILKEMAERLEKSLRSGDTVARQGGDEFIILLQSVGKIDNVTNVVKKIFLALDPSFAIDVREITMTASLGISIYPDDGEDVETLLKNADIAMYQAKAEGRNTYKFFTPAMNEKAFKRLELERRLRRAVEREEFLLYYQPEVDIKTGEVIGMEALLRWQNPELGIISPGEFIPVAEDTGLIIPIGEWVLHAACRQNKAWQSMGLKPIVIAVNISMRQFKQTDFLGKIMKVLDESGLSPEFLELELTESIIMEDAESVIGILNKLKAVGVRLAIDDFGTGYSSLEYLKRMPIDKIKIAQSFVRSITTDENDMALATTIIRIGHSMKMSVIAEGVETIEQFKLLRSLHCDMIQGYLIARPAPEAGIELFLDKELFLDISCS